MTDEAIIERVLNGNTHIFSELVNRYKDKVFSMVYRFTNDHNEAQDLSQEVFIQIFKNLHTFQEKSKLSTWIYRVSYNLCIDWSRRNKKRLRQVYTADENIELADENLNVEENYITLQKKITLRNAINNLDEKYKTVLILFHYQGLSYEEIGEVLKMPVKTIETRLYRGRNMLRKHLLKYSYGGEFYEVQSGG